MNKFIEKLVLGTGITAVVVSVSAFTLAQSTVIAPVPQPAASPTKAPPQKPIPVLPSAVFPDQTSEKSIKVDASVNLTLDCVSDAKVKINGWNRNEVRVFIERGSSFGFKVLEKSEKTGDPVWIKIIGIVEKNRDRMAGDCLSGGDIEIDAPFNATVNIRGREVVTIIDSVKKAKIDTIGGDIIFRKIPDGVTASAGVGDITVEQSGGSMMLDSTTGNILVFDVKPSEIGDVFKAKTHSGAIFLQQVGHRQIDVNSISGSVAFNSEILNGGSYRMSTSKGSIRVSIPADSSGQIYANYGYGSFNTEIPIKITTETISEGPIKSIVGTYGKGGETILKLSASNGSISIKKL